MRSLSGVTTTGKFPPTRFMQNRKMAIIVDLHHQIKYKIKRNKPLKRQFHAKICKIITYLQSDRYKLLEVTGTLTSL
jgi:hypothetical protein